MNLDFSLLNRPTHNRATPAPTPDTAKAPPPMLPNLALLAANDTLTPPACLLLTYEVDGKKATYRDPTNEPLADAIAVLARLYGDKRLGRVWHNGIIVYPTG